MSKTARTVVAGFVVVGFVLASTPADARPRPAGHHAKFEANKEFGLGFMFGVPTGLSGKWYLSRDTALDFGLGVWGRRRGYRDSLHIHADFLWHPVVLAKAQPFWVPLYFGVGGRWVAFDNDFGNSGYLGVRVPGGIMLDFQNVPIDIFFEIAFVLDVIVPNNADHADFNGAIGLRYYF